MTAQYTVKFNGKWYKAGEEIEETQTVFSSFSYTKTDINRMSTADLQALAKGQGIGGAELLSGAELKKLLIERFNL
nr:MAG TPA: Rho termination factor, N-terminal domain [Caudoviricetes sp.]